MRRGCVSVEESEDGKENNGRVRARLESQWCRSGNSNVRRAGAAATWTDYHHWGLLDLRLTIPGRRRDWLTCGLAPQ